MTDSGSSAGRHPVVLGPGEGRAYPMGRLSAVFKADGEETRQGYSISEWWLDAHTKGPGPHSHPEDDVFYVLAWNFKREILANNASRLARGIEFYFPVETKDE